MEHVNQKNKNVVLDLLSKKSSVDKSTSFIEKREYYQRLMEALHILFKYNIAVLEKGETYFGKEDVKFLKNMSTFLDNLAYQDEFYLEENDENKGDLEVIIQDYYDCVDQERLMAILNS